MSYYMGDYYGSRNRRGTIRGDPGFFSFLGGLAKSAAGFIPGVGPIIQKGLELIPSHAAGAPGGLIPKAIEAGRGAIKVAGGIIKKHPVLTAAGGAGAIAAGGALVHHLRGGGGGGRRRRMNACNPRALRRAIRRTHAFAKLAMKTIHLVHPKKKARFGGFRRKKAKR